MRELGQGCPAASVLLVSPPSPVSPPAPCPPQPRVPPAPCPVLQCCSHAAAGALPVLRSWKPEPGRPGWEGGAPDTPRCPGRVPQPSGQGCRRDYGQGCLAGL